MRWRWCWFKRDLSPLDHGLGANVYYVHTHIIKKRGITDIRQLHQGDQTKDNNRLNKASRQIELMWLFSTPFYDCGRVTFFKFFLPFFHLSKTGTQRKSFCRFRNLSFTSRGQELLRISIRLIKALNSWFFAIPMWRHRHRTGCMDAVHLDSGLEWRHIGSTKTLLSTLVSLLNTWEALDTSRSRLNLAFNFKLYDCSMGFHLAGTMKILCYQT